jgi:hypothetical protein
VAVVDTVLNWDVLVARDALDGADSRMEPTILLISNISALNCSSSRLWAENFPSISLETASSEAVLSIGTQALPSSSL